MAIFNDNYICALDIGSSKIAASVAVIRGRRITDIFFESIYTKGIKKGAVIDSLSLVNCVAQVLKKLKAKSGINIKSVYTNLSGLDLVTRHSHATIPLTEKGNKVITPLDIQKVNEQARILGSSLEEEIIHQIPFSYSIDSKDGILNPLGLYSHSLEVDLYLACGKLASIQNLGRAINQAGYEVKDIFFTGITTGQFLFDNDFKNGVSVFCDIGSDITEVSIFKDGLLRDIGILSMGGDDLTEQLSQDLKIPFDLAEEVKISYGIIADPIGIKEDKEILLKKNNKYKPIKQRLVVEILSAKTKSMCASLKKELEKKIAPAEINNFVVAGRTLLLEGLLESLENILGFPVKIARLNPGYTPTLNYLKKSTANQYIQDIVSLVNRNKDIAGQKYLTYLTSLGIVSYALYNSRSQFLGILEPVRNPVLNIINRFRAIYQEYF